jgi:dipeptidase E
MKKLILSGGGGPEDSKEIDIFFVGLLPKNPNILYIPIAINTVKHPYVDCFNWVKSVFEPLGINKITMWIDLNGKKSEDLKNFDAIYIGGGNTFKLLNDFRRTGFDKLLLRFIKESGIVYGGSAGAIILSREIDAAELRGDTNDVGLKDTSGLDLTNGFQVWCHYTKDQDKQIVKYMKGKNFKIIALSERSGIYVNDSHIKCLGSDNVIVFDKEKKITYTPNSIINQK